MQPALKGVWKREGFEIRDKRTKPPGQTEQRKATRGELVRSQRDQGKLERGMWSLMPTPPNTLFFFLMYYLKGKAQREDRDGEFKKVSILWLTLQTDYSFWARTRPKSGARNFPVAGKDSSTRVFQMH